MTLLFLITTPTYAAKQCTVCHTAHYSSIGGCKTCHRGNSATARPELAHKGLIKGRYARFMTADESLRAKWRSGVAALGCRRCHRIGGQGNSLAADLDLISRQKSPEELAAAIRIPARAMPDFRLDDSAIDEVIPALLAAAAAGGQTSGVNRQLVHFDSSAGATENIFTEKCGGCHRALTSSNGSLGRGDVAPNLSGLFSRYYPGSYVKGERWSKERVEKWLKNPRQVRKDARMQPVEVTAEELLEIQKLLNQGP